MHGTRDLKSMTEKTIGQSWSDVAEFHRAAYSRLQTCRESIELCHCLLGETQETVAKWTFDFHGGVLPETLTMGIRKAPRVEIR